MDKSLQLELLGLFTVPPKIQIQNKEDRTKDNQLINQAKDFFGTSDNAQTDNGVQEKIFVDKKEQKNEKMIQKQLERRERHLKLMDDTKKMYIDQILKRNYVCSTSEFQWELLEYEMQNENQGNFQEQSLITKEYLEHKKKEKEKKFKETQDITYFDQLQQAIQISVDEFDTTKIQELRIDRFPLLISNMDQILKSFLDFKQPIYELCLNSTFLTASECLVLAENPQFQHLKKLNLSCNPITAKGLLYLIHPNYSKLSEKFKELELFSCEIDYTQSYLISNDQLQSGKVKFNLQKLNLSYNNLNTFLKYIVEFNLVNPNLQDLYLKNCSLNDDHLIDLVSSNEGLNIQSLETLDISNNQLSSNFQIIIQQIKESSDFLQNLNCGNNPGIKKVQKMQISKSKKMSESPTMLIRLDLQNCLRGDEQIAQLAQSSYLKDLKWLNLTHCKFGTDGINEIFCSKNLRSLEVLIVKDNKIKEIEGPFTDLQEATEKQLKKEIMQLQLLDIRNNKIENIQLKKAKIFLKETSVLMWDNPFKCEEEIKKEYYDPACLFRSSDIDDELYQNPLHIYSQPFQKQIASLNQFQLKTFNTEFNFIYNDI